MADCANCGRPEAEHAAVEYMTLENGVLSDTHQVKICPRNVFVAEPQKPSIKDLRDRAEAAVRAYPSSRQFDP